MGYGKDRLNRVYKSSILEVTNKIVTATTTATTKQSKYRKGWILFLFYLLNMKREQI